MGYMLFPVACGKPFRSGVHGEGDIADITTTMEEDPNNFSLLNLRKVQLSEPFASIYVVLWERSRILKIHFWACDSPRCS